MRSLRYRLLLGAIVLVILLAAIWYLQNQSAKRDAAARDRLYQQRLAEFEQVIKPGMNRDEVESYLRSRGLRFKQMCCVTGGTRVAHGWDDIVKIGEEPIPFVCREHNVYIAFEFKPKAAEERPGTNSSDRLKRVSVFRYLEQCL